MSLHALTHNPAAPGAPLAITQEGLRRCIDSAGAAQQALQVKDGKPLDNAPSAKVRDGVAIITIAGPLSKQPSFWSWIFGGSNYESIGRDLRQSMESTEVRAIALHIDTPGGDASGCAELAALIRSYRGLKPIKAYVSGSCCSAGYWIASAADEIICDPAALLGSIGVRTTLVDPKKMLETAGVTVYEVTSEQSPLKVVDASIEADRARVKATLTSMAAVFIADVAAGRAVTTAKVLEDFGRGDVLVGRAAVAAGLADRLGDFESLVKQLSASGSAPGTPAGLARRRTTTATGASMSMKSKECNGCRNAMDDEDDVYCTKCGGKESAAALSQILVLTGKSTAVEALATIAGWKVSADRVVAVEQAAAQQALQVKAAEFDRLLAEATQAGKIPPAAEHPTRVYALGLRAAGPDALRAYVAALPAGIAPALAPRADDEVKKRQAAQTAIAALNESDLHVAKKLGIKPEDFAAHKKELADKRAAFLDNPSQES